MWSQAWFWYQQHRFEDAKSEALRVVDAFEKLGAMNDVERIRELLRRIEQADGTSHELDDNGELLKMVPPVVFVDLLCSDRVSESV